MGKRALVTFLGLLTVAMMLVVSCSSPDTTTAPQTSAPATTTAATNTTAPTTTAAVGKPTYGGTLVLIQPTNITIFGAAISNRPGGTPAMWEQVTTSDRTRSVAGGGASPARCDARRSFVDAAAGGKGAVQVQRSGLGGVTSVWRRATRCFRFNRRVWPASRRA